MDNSITHYLQQDNQMFSHLLPKLKQMQEWNSWLKECLTEENLVITEHCFIVNLVGTSLIAIADNPHWVTRFRFHIPELIVKLKHYPGLEKIQAICCKVQPNYIPVSKERQPQQKLSLDNAALLREVAEKVGDDKLKAVLESIAGR